MEELYNEFEIIQNEFHETIEHYPLLKSQIDKLFDVDIKEIENFLDKNDEFYLKKAIAKLKALINDIKIMSQEVNNIYDKYNKLAVEWDNIKFKNNVSKIVINKLNNDVNIANSLITGNRIEELNEAVLLLTNVIKESKVLSNNL